MSSGIGLRLSLGRQVPGAEAPASFLAKLQSLFSGGRLGGIWDATDTARLAQNSDGTGAVASAGDPIGWLEDLSGNGNHLVQGQAALKPALAQDENSGWFAEFDGADDRVAPLLDCLGPDFTLVMAIRDYPLIASFRFSFGTAPSAQIYAGLRSGETSSPYQPSIDYPGGARTRVSAPITDVFTLVADSASGTVTAFSGATQIFTGGGYTGTTDTGLTLNNRPTSGLPTGLEFYRGLCIDAALTGSDLETARTWAGELMP